MVPTITPEFAVPMPNVVAPPPGDAVGFSGKSLKIVAAS